MNLLLMDTNIIVALVRGQGVVSTASLPYINSAGQVLASVVSQGEIRVLARRNSWGPSKVRIMQDIIDKISIVNIAHPDVIDAYVEIDVYSKAQNMGKNDLWIAACAKAAGADLITADKDFDHLHPHILNVIKVP